MRKMTKLMCDLKTQDGWRCFYRNLRGECQYDGEITINIGVSYDPNATCKNFLIQEKSYMSRRTHCPYCKSDDSAELMDAFKIKLYDDGLQKEEKWEILEFLCSNCERTFKYGYVMLDQKDSDVNG